MFEYQGSSRHIHRITGHADVNLKIENIYQFTLIEGQVTRKCIQIHSLKRFAGDTSFKIFGDFIGNDFIISLGFFLPKFDPK